MNKNFYLSTRILKCYLWIYLTGIIVTTCIIYQCPHNLLYWVLLPILFWLGYSTFKKIKVCSSTPFIIINPSEIIHENKIIKWNNIKNIQLGCKRYEYYPGPYLKLELKDNSIHYVGISKMANPIGLLENIKLHIDFTYTKTRGLINQEKYIILIIIFILVTIVFGIFCELAQDKIRMFIHG